MLEGYQILGGSKIFWGAPIFSFYFFRQNYSQIPVTQSHTHIFGMAYLAWHMIFGKLLSRQEM